MASTKNTHQIDQPASSSPSSPPSSAASSSAPITKMTNASSEPMAQHHQLELIRLLAQHFNNQLASRAATVYNQQLPPPLTSTSGGTFSNFQSALVHYQQQHEQQFRSGQGAINFCTQRNRASNFEAPLPSRTFANNYHCAKTQPSTNSTLNLFSVTSPMMSTTNSSSIGLAPSALQTAACNPLVTDMNVFNALNCFNLPNEHLVLSLQQQYLFQEANAARQNESRFGSAQNDDLTSNNGRQPSLDANGRQNQQHHMTKQHYKGNLSELGDEMATDRGGRELLKFSINTILGNSSPLQSACSANDYQQSRANASPIDRFFGVNSNQLMSGSKVADENQDSTRSIGQPISTECDPDIMTDIDSETSLSPVSNLRTEAGMATNLSRLVDDAEQPNHHLHHHQSASTSATATPKKGVTTSSLTSSESGHHHAPISFLAGSTAFPWTVASRGKPRRGMMRRAVFSDTQRVGLEKRFQLQKYISKPDRKKLAEKLGLRDSQVKIWFQNRRMKWRNSKERELLSAGGSREQTLPTRNNPNPDLSDVGETFKRLTGGNSNVV